jgi:hypothetical protein
MEFTKKKNTLKVSTFETSLAVQKDKTSKKRKEIHLLTIKEVFFFSFSRFNTLMHELPLVQSLMTAIKQR